MSQSKTPRPLRRLIITLLTIIAGGAVLAPVAVYVFGTTLLAPYEGDGGVLGFLGSVYGDAWQGKAAAWGLLLSPTAFLLTWWAVFRLLRAGRTPAEAGH